MRLVGITSATKGALDNKVTVDIQMGTSANLTAMASRYVVLKASLQTCKSTFFFRYYIHFYYFCKAGALLLARRRQRAYAERSHYFSAHYAERGNNTLPPVGRYNKLLIYKALSINLTAMVNCELFVAFCPAIAKDW